MRVVVVVVGVVVALQMLVDQVVEAVVEMTELRLHLDKQIADLAAVAAVVKQIDQVVTGDPALLLFVTQIRLKI
jgi:hypothetical protein